MRRLIALVVLLLCCGTACSSSISGKALSAAGVTPAQPTPISPATPSGPTETGPPATAVHTISINVCQLLPAQIVEQNFGVTGLTTQQQQESDNQNTIAFWCTYSQQGQFVAKLFAWYFPENRSQQSVDQEATSTMVNVQQVPSLGDGYSGTDVNNTVLVYLSVHKLSDGDTLALSFSVSQSLHPAPAMVLSTLQTAFSG